MRFVYTRDLQEGVVLGRSIYNASTGDTLLQKGTLLKKTYINKLKKLGIDAVFIEDEFSKDIADIDTISSSLKLRASQSIYNFFSDVRNSHTNAVKDVMGLKNLVMDIILGVYNLKTPALGLQDLRCCDNYTYMHSINVAILSLIIGKEYGYSQDELEILGLGALLHDIGKMFTPVEILNKKGSLSGAEFDIMKKHSHEGYTYLRDDLSLGYDISLPALQHHENVNGSGYPLKETGESLATNSKIVAIADVFDALTSNRPYKGAITPDLALDELNLAVGDKFDPVLFETAKKVLVPFPEGLEVTLSNGYKGFVVKNNYPNFKEPLIRVFKDEYGNIINPFNIDLSVNKTLKILGGGLI